MVDKREDLRKFEQKYRAKIEKELAQYTKKKATTGNSFGSTDDNTTENVSKVESRQYQEFKKQWVPKNLTLYESACNFSEKIIKISPDKAEEAKLQEAINTCHINVTPTGVKSFAIVGPLMLVILVSLLSFIPFIINPNADASAALFFVVFSVVVALILIIPLGSLPELFASSWRMKASNQMVLAIFYIVTYMRHTSNLENAIDFAAEHLPAPLSLDMKKVIWDVETQKYSNIKDSLDAYLNTWKKDSMEFVESMHLIESSLYENSETRRLNSLEKSLTLILDETYEKMLHYAHNLQGPLTMLNMLGIVLPILGLVILPLVVSFMEQIKWYHLFALYNIVLPIGVYYLSRTILSTRPTGYGDTDISENNPEIRKHRNILIKVGSKELQLHPGFIAISLFLILFLVGISPLILHAAAPAYDVGIDSEYNIRPLRSPTSCENAAPNPIMKFQLLGYKCNTAGELVGPFGLGAAILSLFIPLSIGVGLGLYFRLRSQNVMKIREESKKLEQEFAGALFQLGNRIGDGIPAEIAFSKVAEVMNGTTSGKFFELVSINITKLGMNVEDAIFDKKRGAIIYYPSSIIESAMKVLIESSKKGPLVASQSLINVSEYIKQIHRVDERLKDLMADTISSLQSQISFLTPAIAGIVIGITSMITGIIGNLSDQMKVLSQGIGTDAAGSAGMGANFGDMFGLGLPTFYFQVIVGIYVIQIIYIMTILVNGVQNGSDSLNERYMLGRNLLTSTILYIFIALIVMIIFNMVAGLVTGGITAPGA